MSPILCLALLGAAGPPADGYVRAHLLVEAEALKKDEAGRPLLLDARKKEDYQAGHVPGAVHVDGAAWAKAFNDDRSREGWEKRLREAFVSGEGPVVVYDDGPSKDAARVWWILRYWGVREARLLNGGWAAWKAAGGEVTKDEPKHDAVRAVRLSPEFDRLAIKPDIVESLKEKRLQIVDARSEGEHCGTEKMAKRGGSIPGAKHLDWSDLIDGKTKKFKPAPELQKLFKEANIDPRKPTATYCQSGGRAAVMALALELVGAEHVRNYYRSWAEWGNDDDTPVDTPRPKSKR